MKKILLDSLQNSATISQKKSFLGLRLQILFFTIFIKIISCQRLSTDFFASDPDFLNFFNDDPLDGNKTFFSNSTNNTTTTTPTPQSKVASSVKISQLKITSTSPSPVGSSVDRSMRFNPRGQVMPPAIPFQLLASNNHLINNKILPRHVNQKFIIRDFPRKQFLMAHPQQLQGASNHRPGFFLDHPRGPKVYSTETGLELNLEPGFAVSFDFADQPELKSAQFLNSNFRPAYGRGQILPVKVVNSHKFPQYRGASVTPHTNRAPVRMQPGRHNNYQDFRTQTQLHFNNEANKEDRKRQSERSGKAMPNSGKVVEFLNYEDNYNNNSNNDGNNDQDKKQETKDYEEENGRFFKRHL